MPETEGQLPLIPVAAGILVRGGRILICQRHHTDCYGLEWEFPGGKIREDESPQAGLRRELEEELGLEAEIGPEVYRLRHRYPDRHVEVAFFRVDGFRGEPVNRVFESIAWAEPGELAGYKFLAADRDLVQRLARGEIVS